MGSILRIRDPKCRVMVDDSTTGGGTATEDSPSKKKATRYIEWPFLLE